MLQSLNIPEPSKDAIKSSLELIESIKNKIISEGKINLSPERITSDLSPIDSLIFFKKIDWYSLSS